MQGRHRRVLILGGTGEARQLADRATQAIPKDVEIISSFAGRTRRPTDPPGTIREGGFGGIDDLAAYIRANAIDALIDATHPFAAVISRHAAAASEATGCPRLVLRRADWVMPDAAIVINVADMAEAARTVAQATVQTKRVFLTTGTQNLDAFAGLKNTWFLVRLITPPIQPLPLAGYSVTTGRPPFDLVSEMALLRNHQIDNMISKHSGGPLPAKIAAASALGIPIILVQQPTAPPGDRADTIDGALTWITAQVLSGRNT